MQFLKKNKGVTEANVLCSQLNTLITVAISVFEIKSTISLPNDIITIDQRRPFFHFNAVSNGNSLRFQIDWLTAGSHDADMLLFVLWFM